MIDTRNGMSAMRKNKKKLLLTSIAGLTVLGSIVGNYLIKEGENFITPPPEQ